MSKRMFGAALAIIIVVMSALVLPSASGDTSDAHEVELYAGSSFVYSPAGDWTDAKAYGTALDAGMEWTDGTLSGRITTPGTYYEVFEKTGASCEITLKVLPTITINQYSGSALTGDSVVVSGAKEGMRVFPVTVSGPEETAVSFEYDRQIFAMDENKNFVLARDMTDSDAGTYTLTVRASHESGPLYSEASLKVTVTVVSQADASGLDFWELAYLGTCSSGMTYVVTQNALAPVHHSNYAAPEEPAVTDIRLAADGRDVKISSTVTDAEKITYNWGDGTRTFIDAVSVLNTAHHTYRQNGTYSAVMTVDGPYSSAYVVAIFDADVDESKTVFEEHGWIFVLFAVLAFLSLIVFLFVRDVRMLYALIASAILAIVCFVLRVGA